jgi:hypothetical protein
MCCYLLLTCRQNSFHASGLITANGAGHGLKAEREREREEGRAGRVARVTKIIIFLANLVDIRSKRLGVSNARIEYYSKISN